MPFIASRARREAMPIIEGLHSSTFKLNGSIFCEILRGGCRVSVI